MRSLPNTEHSLPISKNDVAILTLEDWETSAGPRSPDHWTDGRSAKEAARAWLEGDAVDPPKELMAALKIAYGFNG